MDLGNLVNKGISTLALALSITIAGHTADMTIDTSKTKSSPLGNIRTISSAFYDSKIVEPPKESKTELPYSIQIKSNHTDLDDKIIIGLFIHGYKSDAQTAWLDSGLADNIRVFNGHELDHRIFFDYQTTFPVHTLAKDRPSNQQLTDHLFKVMDEFYKNNILADSNDGKIENKDKIDFNKIITVPIAHSNGGIILWKLLQDHPNLIDKYNMAGIFLLGPPLKGANEIMKAIDFTLLSPDKQMQEFTGQSELIRQIYSNTAPMLPIAIIFGDVNEKDAKGIYKASHPLIIGDDDGIVMADNNDMRRCIGYEDIISGGLDIRIRTNLNHSALTRDPKTLDIISNVSTFWHNLSQNNYNSNNNPVNLKLEGPNLIFEFNRDYDIIKEYLTMCYDYTEALRSKGIKEQGFSIDYFGLMPGTHTPILKLSSNDDEYTLRFYGNNMVTLNKK